MPENKEKESTSEEIYVKVDQYGSILNVKVSEDGFYLCPLCGSKFSSFKDLVAHVLSHFSEEQGLRRHIS